MKRKLALVMAMLMVLGTLPACSSNSGGSPSEKGGSAVSGGAAGTEAGAVIETGDKINSTYTNNTPDANLSVTALCGGALPGRGPDDPGPAGGSLR